MIRLTKFNDHCTITRSTGETDEYGEPIVKPVYDDVCNFQGGGQTSLSNVTHNDVVYLPTNDVLIEQGDSIKVVTKKGRVRKGVVKDPRDIVMPRSGIECTEIEIRRSKDSANTSDADTDGADANAENDVIS